MKEAKKIDLNMTGLDELFMTDEQRKEKSLPKIYDIPLSEIDEFPDHPFRVNLDDDMQLLVESIRQRGVLTPVTVRKKDDGRYELISGHRRKKACELAGLDKIRAEVRELSKDEAIIAMVESNYQRSEILPSEKAHAYKMMFEAMKRQGERTDLTSSPPGTKPRTTETMSQIVGDSRSQIDRYIRLTELIPELLDMVDSGKISLRPAYELSFLSKDEQRALFDAIEYIGATPSHAQAIRMKECSRTGSLKMSTIGEIMNEEKPNQADRISVRFSDVRRYIPESVPFDKTAEYIMKALEVYSQYLESERQKSKAHSSREAR